MDKLFSDILKRYPYLKERKFGFPDVGKRLDNKPFSKYVKGVEDGFSIYDYILNNLYDSKKDLNFTSGNPLSYDAYPPIIKRLDSYIHGNELYKYPYSEGDDRVRKVLLDYVEKIGIKNDDAYDYNDIDSKGLSVNNLTMCASTSQAFNYVIDIIARPYDVIITTAPNYGLFTFKPERLNVNVEVVPLLEEDNYLINPKRLDDKVKEINDELKDKYKDLDYVPKVVAFLNSNPNNPLGNYMGECEKERLEELGQVIKDNNMFIIDDLIYRDICFDGDIAKPIASLDGMFKNTISLFGLSKSYGMASLRAGFVVADEIIIREIVNKIFRELDAVPAIIGEALAGAFGSSEIEYDEYFSKLREEYKYRYNLFKTMVLGINCCDKKYRNRVVKSIKRYDSNYDINKGIDGVKIKCDVKVGFFIVLDFTELKGKRYADGIINEDEDLLIYLYKNINLRYLIGKSIAWPNEDELVGRFTFAKSEEDIVEMLDKLKRVLEELV